MPRTTPAGKVSHVTGTVVADLPANAGRLLSRVLLPARRGAESARGLAARSARAAAAVASQASREAERLAGQARNAAERPARDRASATNSRAARSQSGPPRPARSQSRPASPARSQSGPPRPARHKSRPASQADSQAASGQVRDLAGRSRMTDPVFLRSLTRAELQRLADDLEVTGGPDLTKEQLDTAIVRAGGARLDDLTNAELLRLGRRRGDRVTSKMNKTDLLAALTAAQAG